MIRSGTLLVELIAPPVTHEFDQTTVQALVGMLAVVTFLGSLSVSRLHQAAREAEREWRELNWRLAEAEQRGPAQRDQLGERPRTRRTIAATQRRRLTVPIQVVNGGVGSGANVVHVLDSAYRDAFTAFRASRYLATMTLLWMITFTSLFISEWAAERSTGIWLPTGGVSVWSARALVMATTALAGLFTVDGLLLSSRLRGTRDGSPIGARLRVERQTADLWKKVLKADVRGRNDANASWSGPRTLATLRKTSAIQIRAFRHAAMPNSWTRRGELIRSGLGVVYAPWWFVRLRALMFWAHFESVEARYIWRSAASRCDLEATVKEISDLDSLFPISLPGYGSGLLSVVILVNGFRPQVGFDPTQIPSAGDLALAAIRLDRRNWRWWMALASAEEARRDFAQAGRAVVEAHRCIWTSVSAGSKGSILNPAFLETAQAGAAIPTPRDAVTWEAAWKLVESRHLIREPWVDQILFPWINSIHRLGLKDPHGAKQQCRSLRTAIASKLKFDLQSDDMGWVGADGLLDRLESPLIKCRLSLGADSDPDPFPDWRQYVNESKSDWQEAFDKSRAQTDELLKQANEVLDRAQQQFAAWEAHQASKAPQE
jgi:hypothetical protein